MPAPTTKKNPFAAFLKPVKKTEKEQEKPKAKIVPTMKGATTAFGLNGKVVPATNERAKWGQAMEGRGVVDKFSAGVVGQRSRDWLERGDKEWTALQRDRIRQATGGLGPR